MTEIFIDSKKKEVIFIIGDWNAKVGNQRIPEVTDNFGLGVQNEAGQRLTVLPREHTGHSKHPLPNTRDNSMLGHHQIVNTEIRLIIYLQLKMEKVYIVSKYQTWSLLWLRSLAPISKIQALIEESRENH